MFGVAKTVGKANLEVIRYSNQPAVVSSHFDKKSKSYTYQRDGLLHRARGLRNYLKRNFYPHFKTPRRRFSKGSPYQKLPSSKALGKRVDRELQKIVVAGNKEIGRRRPLPMPKKIHPLTQGILDYWKARGLRPVAAQLPVQMPALGLMTQADIIVEDPQERLWMHEIKTGYVGLHVTKGQFKAPFHTKTCSKGAVWDLQRFFTEKALVEQGLPLEGSKIVHAYEVYDKKTKSKRTVVKDRPRVFF